MRKITLLLTGFILYVGYMNAQVPPISTDDTGPWFFIKVKGKDGDSRQGRIFTGQEDAVAGTLNVYGRFWGEDTDHKDEEGNATPIDIDNQLWRIEKSVVLESGAQTYTFINKGLGLKMYSWLFDREKAGGTASTSPAIGLTDDPGNNGNFLITTHPKDANCVLLETIAPIEGSASKLYAHQGNSGWQWNIIIETAQWGYGDDSSESQLYFIGYRDGITVQPAAMNYGPIMLGKASDNKSFTIGKIEESADEFSFEIIGDDADYFAVEEGKDWDAQIGGTLVSFFEPDEGEGERDYSASLKITAGDAEMLVPLSGNAIKNTPGEVSEDEDEHWYRIQFNKRYAYYMQDLGAGKELDAYPGFSEGEYVDGQLWKIVAADTREKYKLVSKLGNEIKFNEETELFESAGSSDFELGFDVLTDGSWVISWPEFENIDDEGVVTLGTYFNKTVAPGIGVEEDMTDEGNSVVFIPADEAVETPEFPSMNTEYYIQFTRPAGLSQPSYITNKGVGNDVKLEVLVEDNEAQIWTFVGKWNDFKIVSKLDNSEFKDVKSGTDDMTQLAAAGEGYSYRFLPPLDGSDAWAIYDNDMPDPENGNDYKFLNHYGGGTSISVGLYSIPDAGANLLFVPVDGSSIDNIYTDANDPVVSTTYYTVQGVQVTKPTAEGVYIVRMKHESQKVTAKKIIYRKN